MLKVLKKIVAHRSPHSEPINILLQLKIGDEVTKSGATFNEIIEMAEYLLESDAAILRGLMCIPPPSSQRGTQERYFKEAKKAFDTLQKSHASVDTLSMGMSGDLEAAINCGSTVVRVGTDIFGRRA